MPAKSQAQANLFRAAEHGAQFGMAKKLRQTMTLGAMHDFAATKSANLPAHVRKAKHPARNLQHYLHPRKRGR